MPPIRPIFSSAPSGSRASSAPVSSAHWRASARASTAITREAPSVRAMPTADRPSPPVPQTTTRLPSVTPPR